MSITAERKNELVTQFAQNSKDTGSVEVQCSILTERIVNLVGHSEIHKKDFSSKRGLMKLIGQRRRLLNYLKNKDFDKYKTLIERLGLRK
jgi:small subunit ribosomal protein S15